MGLGGDRRLVGARNRVAHLDAVLVLRAGTPHPPLKCGFASAAAEDQVVDRAGARGCEVVQGDVVDDEQESGWRTEPQRSR